MSIMSAYIAAPQFTEEVLTKAKTEILAHITAQDKYYAESITKATIQNLSINDVKAYYNEIVNPATAYLTVVGNVKVSTIKTYAKKGFNNLKVTGSDFKRIFGF